MPISASQAMAIDANDVAFRSFGQDLLAVLERGATGAKVERLLARVAMIEVHLVRREPTATVMTGNSSELSQECRRRLLPAPDPLDFALAIGRVIANIRRALVARSRHSPI